MQTRHTSSFVKGIVAVLIYASGLNAFAADPVARIDATARGTLTQSGKLFQLQISISQFSAPEDKQVLVDAFKVGKGPGLAKALSKMKSVGRVSVPGSTGYDIEYATMVQTPTGRKIRFITNRWILFGENYHATRSRDYNLTAAEITIDDQQKDKSSGTLAPAAKLYVNKKGEVTFELFQSPWTLSNIIDWTNKSEK